MLNKKILSVLSTFIICLDKMLPVHVRRLELKINAMADETVAGIQNRLHSPDLRNEPPRRVMLGELLNEVGQSALINHPVIIQAIDGMADRINEAIAEGIREAITRGDERERILLHEAGRAITVKMDEYYPPTNGHHRRR